MASYDTSVLTERELEYFNCNVPLTEKTDAVKNVIFGVIASFFSALGRALFSPNGELSKADRKLIHTLHQSRYSAYKRAVLRKAEGRPGKGDEKLLKKLNRKEFALAEETFDPDDYTQRLYEDYMNEHR